MKRIHFDVEEDGFYGAYWACKMRLSGFLPSLMQPSRRS